MGRRLVTIAAFDQPAKARLTQNALQEAGIQVVVSDESLVAMDWLLSNAIGGVKVQVWEEDADRAVAILEQEFGEDGAGLGPVDVDPDELAAEAEQAAPEIEEDQPAPAAASEPESPQAAAPYSREDYARRMVFTALLGLMVLPVTFYAFYLLMNAAFGQGELSPRGRFYLYLGGAITLAGLAWFAVIPGWLFLEFLE